MPHFGREDTYDLVEKGERQHVGPARIHVHVFVEEFAARDLMRTLAGKNSRRINQADVRILTRYGTNNLIQLSVSAEAKRVEILSAHEALLGSRKITNGP